MLRALSVITPVLGSAMLMLLTDRHWKTSFFDFSYGGDPIFFSTFILIFWSSWSIYFDCSWIWYNFSNCD
jgi:heme/copper-type cytochrome/quinol oxidase subunit 1